MESGASVPLLPSGPYTHTERHVLLRVCMAFAMSPEALDRLIDEDPALVLDMIEVVQIQAEEQARRDEVMARAMVAGMGARR